MKRQESIQVSTLGHDDLGQLKSIDDALNRFLEQRETGRDRSYFRGNAAQRAKAEAQAAERRASFTAPGASIPDADPAPVHISKGAATPTPPPQPIEPAPMPAPDTKAIGSRLKQAREQSGWKGQALANAIGIALSATYDACYGKNQPALDKIVAFLHINPAWLESGNGQVFLNPPPEPPHQGKSSPKPRTSKTPEVTHPLAKQLKSDGFLKRKAVPVKSDLITALQRASAAAEELQRAQDELDASLAELDALRA